MKIIKLFICVIFPFFSSCSLNAAEPSQIGAEETLRAYINELVKFYRSFDSTGEKPGVIRGYNTGIRFWKVGGIESKLAGNESAFFILVNMPESFKFTEVKEAGDFAKIKVKINIKGLSPKEPETKEVEYRLIREGEDWKIVSFKDFVKEKAQKEKKEKEVSFEKHLKELKGHVFSTPEELLEDYFGRLRGVFPPGAINPQKDPVGSLKETGHYWAESKKNQRAISACNSFFNMYSPSTWSFESNAVPPGAVTVAVTVTFVVGNPIWVKLAKDKAVKVVECKLEKHEGSWLLTEVNYK